LRASLLTLVLAAIVTPSAFADWPAPQSPAIPAADGYVAISGVAVPPDPQSTYRAIFDATQAATDPAQILPALNMAGSELNAFQVAGVPNKNVKFVVAFHGDALDGILDAAHYRAKFGISNPNLPVLEQFKKAGVELYVCGQNLAFAKIDPNTLSQDVTLASDALIVLMTYQNRGYALLRF
jgi:intracellular sulfur oxidation DsrE/DsrF family protein